MTTVPADTVAARFSAIETGHVCDALQHLGILTPALSSSIHPITSARKFAGPAATLKLALSRRKDDSRRLNELLEDVATEGEVLVIDAHGNMDAAIFGDRAAFAAQTRGTVGAVINGGARDLDGIERLGYPVHGLGRALAPSEERLQGVELNCDVILGGVLIHAGDWVVADESGICIVPAEILEDVLRLAEERQEIDDHSFEELRAGKTLREVHRHFKDDDIEQLRRTE